MVIKSSGCEISTLKCFSQTSDSYKVSCLNSIETYESYADLYKNVCAGMFLCLLVCGGLLEMQTHAPILMKASHNLSKEGSGASLTPAPPPGQGEPETIQAEGHILENCLQNIRCLAGLQINSGSVGYPS